jgi:UDP-N-acetylmuramoyl-tripeptide--D-alanyl-D-alanine ligase
VRLGVQQLVVIGDPARPVHEGACAESSQRERSVLVADNGAAVAWLRERLQPGDVVLVKASRGARLDLVADAVLDSSSGGSDR